MLPGLQEEIIATGFTNVAPSVNGLIQTVLSLKDDLAQAGKWNLWGYAIFADGREVPGEAEQIHVYEEGYLPRSSSIYN